MTRLIANVDQFTLGELYKISDLLDVDYKTIFTLVSKVYIKMNAGKQSLVCGPIALTTEAVNESLST